MNIDNIAEHLILQGFVSNDINSPLPKLYVYSAAAEEQAASDIYALLLVTPPGFSVDEELPNYHKGGIQVIVSARRHDDGYALAKELSGQLTIYGLDLSDMYVYRCVPKHLPISYPKNEENRIEFSVNFNATIRTK